MKANAISLGAYRTTTPKELARYGLYSRGGASHDTGGSNLPRSTIQSFGFRIYRRIAQNRRVCVRFAISAKTAKL